MLLFYCHYLCGMKKLYSRIRDWHRSRVVKHQRKAEIEDNRKFLRQLVLLAAERYGVNDLQTFDSAHSLWCQTINAEREYFGSAESTAISSPKSEV